MPFFSEDDTRKVQTAVIGRAGSDTPVFLPFDHDEFDAFMRGRSREDFYCGTLLGGCGKKLTARRYTEKKCHFAHRPPVHCRRTANGESSADHLYIGQALLDWLDRQGHPAATVTYPDLGSGPGGAVEIRLGGDPRLIRVQLGRLPLRSWQDDRDRLARRYPRGVHWSYGPDSGLAHNEVEDHGHAIRFSCRTEAGTRKVYLGTQLPGRAVEWTTLATCRLTGDGIMTPTLASAESAPVPVSPSPVAFPLRAGAIAFTGAVEIRGHRTDGTRLYEADIQPEGSPPTRARIILPDQAPTPPPHLIHILTGAAHVLPPEGTCWVIRAAGTASLQCLSDPRWPDLRPSVPPAAPRPVGRAASDDDRLVELLRQKLERVHRVRGLINWETLIFHAGAAPGDFTPVDRVRLLAAVDSPHTPGTPLLSAVVKLAHAAPGPAPFFAEVVARLGLGRDLTDTEVRRLWQESARPQAATRDAHPLSEEDDWLVGEQELVEKLRKHLLMVAKGQSVIKWRTLLKRQGVVAASVSPRARVRLLAAVDQPYTPGKPILSSLVKLDGQRTGPAPFFAEVLSELGWRADSRTLTPEAAWAVERNRAYGLPGPGVGPPVRRPSTPRLADLSEELGISEGALVRSVRQALIDAARRRVTLGWHTLMLASGIARTGIAERDRLAVLVAVDRESAPDGVLLSSLVVGPGRVPLPYFDDVLRHLGRPHAMLPIELGRVMKREQARVFQAYAPLQGAGPEA